MFCFVNERCDTANVWRSIWFAGSNGIDLPAVRFQLIRGLDQTLMPSAER